MTISIIIPLNRSTLSCIDGSYKLQSVMVGKHKRRLPRVKVCLLLAAGEIRNRCDRSRPMRAPGPSHYELIFLLAVFWRIAGHTG